MFARLCIALIISCCVPLTAQILRVDKSHLESDSAGYYTANADVSFSLDNRTISPQEKLVFTRLSSKADILYVSKNHAYILINSIEYLSSSNATPFSTGYTHFRINFRRQSKVSYESYTQLQYDGVRKMRLRFLSGGGLRITPIDEEGFDIHFGTGAMYEIEKWNSVDELSDMPIVKQIPKLSNYIGVDFELSKHVKLHLWGLYQVGYDRTDALFRNRYAGEASLNFLISKRLSWYNRFAYYFDAQPVIEINPAYYQLMNGLRISF